jgi:predicted transposase YbfD/YdcC
VGSILPALGTEIVAIAPKNSRRSGGVDATALHLVSAFAAGAGLVLGQRATAVKSNEITAIPPVALHAIADRLHGDHRRHGDAAELIQARRADCVLAVEDNQPRLVESIEDFWNSPRAHQAIHTPHAFAQTVEKDHGMIETRRRTIFDQPECPNNPQQWKGLRSFIMLESEPIIGDKTTLEQRLYIIRLAPDPKRILHPIRAHWSVENRLH